MMSHYICLKHATIDVMTPSCRKDPRNCMHFMIAFFISFDFRHKYGHRSFLFIIFHENIFIQAYKVLFLGDNLKLNFASPYMDFYIHTYMKTTSENIRTCRQLCENIILVKTYFSQLACDIL